MNTVPPPAAFRLIGLALSVVLLAPLAACGQSASTAMPASTSEYAMPAATVPYSDHLVNGDFETPSLDGTPTDYITSRYANWKYVIPDKGVFQDDNHKDTKSLPISGFNAAAFGWKSDTPAQNGFDTGSVEIQRDVKTGEQFAEIVSENGLYSIYQDVSAKPGEVMRWTLKHAPRGYAGQIDHDSMQVLVGPAGHETVSPRHPPHVERHRQGRRDIGHYHHIREREPRLPPLGDVHGHVSGAGRRDQGAVHVQGLDEKLRHPRQVRPFRQPDRRRELPTRLPAYLRR